jgi:hypothetical protein
MGGPVSTTGPLIVRLLWEHLCVDPQDDPEARIRELERSLSDRNLPGTPAVAYGDPSRPRMTTGLRGRTVLLLVVTAGLVALVAGVAVVIARSSGGGSFTGIPSNRPGVATSKTTTRESRSIQTLYHLLPSGYDSHNCSPVSSPNREALVTVQCGQTSDKQSPPSAAFSVYPNATALANAFQNGVDEDTVTQCPDGNQSPATWSTEAAPNVPAGSVLCGNYKDGPDLLWTKNSDLLIGDLQGPDLKALYHFWQTF